MEKMQRALDEDEVLKNQLVGWGAALAATLLALAAGAGAYSALLGLFAAVVAMTLQIIKKERKGVAK
jgi:4-hydroxybenzoate polyprenyltransferase